MTSDLPVLGVLAVLTGLLITVHVLIVAGLFGRRPLRPALVALSLPPSAPILAYRAGFRTRACIWAIAAIGYVIVRLSFQV
jgi:hypothetical protein